MKSRFISLGVLVAGCALAAEPAVEKTRPALVERDAKNAPVKPRVVTEPTKHDTDDPAI